MVWYDTYNIWQGMVGYKVPTMYGKVWCGMVWYGTYTIRYGVVRYLQCLTRYGVLWYGAVPTWLGMVWYGNYIVRYGVVYGTYSV